MKSEEQYVFELAKRGKRYLYFAGDIFDSRYRKMLDEWVKLYGNCYSLEDIRKSERLSNIAAIYMNRLKLAAHEHYLITEKEAEEKRVLDNSPVYPRCHNQCCPKHTMMIVLYKAYVPGKLICEGCGRPLETDEERELHIQAMKALHGIKH